LKGLSDINPPGMLLSHDTPPALPGGYVSAGSGIWVSMFIKMGGDAHALDFRLDGTARAETGVDHAHFAQPVQGLTVFSTPPALPDNLSVPANTKPAQILEEGLSIFRSTARVVEILDSE
jgi:hypothetical protein